jgi:hypothetical protein
VTATLSAASAAKLEPLAALLASNPDYQILIEAYTDNKGNEVSLAAVDAGTCARAVGSLPVGGRRSDANSGQRHGRVKPACAEHYGCGSEKESPRRDHVYVAVPKIRRRIRLGLSRGLVSLLMKDKKPKT